MALTTGTISRDKDVLISDVTIDLVPAGSGGLMPYSGSLQQPPGQPFLQVGENYTLALNDGRLGKILIDRADTGSRRPTVFHFRTSGRFDRSV